MTFLDLVKRLRQECGVSGNGPTTVSNQSGEMKRLCDWIAQAYLEIQEKRPNWNWMVSPFSLQTVANDYEYTATDAGIDTTFANWKMDTLRSYLTSTGYGTEQFVYPMAYDDFRNFYLFSTRRDSLSKPLYAAVSPSKSLLLGPVPNDIYTITGEYYKLPVLLANDSDTPEMPSRFHMAIVYRAMVEYGMFEAAPEVVQRGQARFDEIIKKIEDDQLFDVTLPGAMA